jgi:DNA-binding CsgD family transcriptional regulator
MISTMVPCHSIGYNEWDLDASGGICGYRLFEAPAVPEFHEMLPDLAAHLHEHPLYTAFVNQTETPVKISDFAGNNGFTRSTLYNELYRRVGIQHQLMWYLPRQTGSRICFVLNRQKLDFSERERQLMGYLSPHLRQAHSNVLAQEAARQCGRLLGKFEEEREVVPLSAQATPRWLSERVCKWLRKYFADTSALNPWPETLQCWVRLQAWSHGKGEKDIEVRRPLVVERDDARLTATVVQGNGIATAVLLTETRLRSFAQLAQRLPLTDREREVFCWICEAKTNPEISTILSISPRTVHKHVEHILEKLGVENRSQAQRLGWEWML